MDEFRLFFKRNYGSNNTSLNWSFSRQKKKTTNPDLEIKFYQVEIRIEINRNEIIVPQ